MRFQIGDLVSLPKYCEENLLGVVVKIDKANSKSLLSSTHSSELIKNSSDIYYVFFSDATTSGPYYTSELVLKNGI